MGTEKDFFGSHMTLEHWFLMLTAIATFLAAVAAGLAAWATAKASRGTLVANLYDDYWSAEYLSAARKIREWEKKHGSNHASVFGELHRRDPKLSPEERREFDEVNTARRKVKEYFRKAQQLYFGGYLTKRDITELLCPSHRVELLLEVVEKFEPELNPNYTVEMYDFYRRI